MDSKQDIDLIFQLKKGRMQAFDELYAKYHQALFRNIVRVTRNKQAAEDILQEVFITLWERRMEIDGNKALSGWLFVVSFHKAVNYARKELTELNAKNRFSAVCLRRQDEDHSKEIFEQQYDLVQEAISALSPQKQRVFILCKMEGKTYAEAARALRISKYTVKEYLTAAMILIRDYVRRHPQYVNIMGFVSFLLFHICSSGV